jgi:hypothetical protein
MFFGDHVRIISADSAAAILDENFGPLQQVASAAVLVEPPYREAFERIAEPIFREIDSAYDVIVYEAELCLEMLEMTKADVVHLDTSLGGVTIEDLSPVELSNMNLSTKARMNLLKILPKLRRVAGEVKRKYDIDVRAMGKESVAVRIAELTAGAEAVLFTCEAAVEERKSILLGLPTRCEHKVADGKMYLQSLIEAEHDVRGYAVDLSCVLEQVQLVETLNPVARGFRALQIEPKHA